MVIGLKEAAASPEAFSGVVFVAFRDDAELNILFKQKHTDICHIIIKSSLYMK